jgi:GAF domain-containing protein
MVVLCERNEALPADTEARLSDFTELVATAIANAESREALSALADEQAALRRVATLVASGGGPEPVFRAVADEVQALFGSSMSSILRFEDDGTATTLGTHGDLPTAGTRGPLDPDFVIGSVRSTRRAARFDTDDPTAASMPAIVRETGVRSAVASPIVVEGELWGAIGVGSLVRSLPSGTERRLDDFTELIATAVANTQAREQVRALADEQAALRRVATLVAQGVQPDAIFSAVGEEIGRLFGSSMTTVARFEHDAPALVAVGVGTRSEGVQPGSRWELDDLLASAKVFRTGHSVRVDEVDWSAVRGPLAAIGSRLGVASTVASPIFVEGRLWGVVSVSDNKQLPPEAEERLEKFSELIATAIANAEGKSELVASRRRIVAAADEARRRIERDLHDGIQQRLIALSFRARAMTRKPPDELPGLAAEVAEGVKDASDELREVSRGIHPTILTEAGLGPALRALSRRSSIPIDVDWDVGPTGECPECRSEPDLGEDRGVDAARDLAQLVGGVLEPFRHLCGEARQFVRRFSCHRACAEGERDQPLLDSVVEIPLDPAACLVGGSHDPPA